MEFMLFWGPQLLDLILGPIDRDHDDSLTLFADAESDRGLETELADGAPA